MTFLKKERKKELNYFSPLSCFSPYVPLPPAFIFIHIHTHTYPYTIILYVCVSPWAKSLKDAIKMQNYVVTNEQSPEIYKAIKMVPVGT